MKAGWKTTEFWVVIVSSVVAVAVAAGYLRPDDASAITDSTAQVFEAVARLVEVLAPIVGPLAYVWSRTKIKAA